jgi:hypothetical protein
MTTRNYTVALRHRDVEKASALYGETEFELIEKFNGSGNLLVLFRSDLGTERKFSRPEVISTLKEAGIPRGVEITNLQLAGEEKYGQILDHLKAIDPAFVILRGVREVTLPPDLVAWLDENEVLPGTVEFRNRETTQKLVAENDLNWVRLHRVFDKEVGTLTPVEKEARYERAVRERNIGVIEYRLPLNTDLSTQINIFNSVRDGLAGSGYRLRSIDEVRGAETDLESSLWLTLTLIVSISVLALRGLWPDRESFYLLVFWALVSATVGFLGLKLYPILARQVTALGLAVIAPVIGYRLVREFGFSFTDDRSSVSPFLDLIWLSGLSTLAGLVISSLLLDQSFVLKLHQFRGVKVSLFLPLILILLFALFREGIRVSEIELDFKKGVIGAALLGLFLFLLLRSGNFTFLRSGDLEEAIRRWLENTLYARPRFKEFVIGHPALIGWFYLAGRYRKKLQFSRLALLLVGFMGQISIINTFAHVHTPVIISLIRTGNGLAGGLILGAIFLVVILGGEYVWNLRKG